jgi:putative LysE/RhtB family amino acid efflux pump
MKQENEDDAVRSDYTSAFLLNLTNPTTVISFLAVLTALGLHQHRSFFLSTLLVAGIFSGAMLWWISLALVASRFQGRLTDRAMVWMNRVAGLAIGGFGLFTVALSRRV